MNLSQLCMCCFFYMYLNHSKIATTVGFGDFTPDTQYARALAILFTPCAVLTMGRCIQYVANFIINRRRFQTMESFFGVTSNAGNNNNHQHHQSAPRHQLTWQDLQAMDRNGDGHVSWADFLEFMLLAMNQVDANMIQELRKQFDRLDKTGAFDKRQLQHQDNLTLPYMEQQPSSKLINNLTRRQHQQPPQVL